MKLHLVTDSLAHFAEEVSAHRGIWMHELLLRIAWQVDELLFARGTSAAQPGSRYMFTRLLLDDMGDARIGSKKSRREVPPGLRAWRDALYGTVLAYHRRRV